MAAARKYDCAYIHRRSLSYWTGGLTEGRVDRAPSSKSYARRQFRPQAAGSGRRLRGPYLRLRAHFSHFPRQSASRMLTLSRAGIRAATRYDTTVAALLGLIRGSPIGAIGRNASCTPAGSATGTSRLQRHLSESTSNRKSIPAVRTERQARPPASENKHGQPVFVLSYTRVITPYVPEYHSRL